MHPRHIAINGCRWVIVLLLCVLAAESVGDRVAAASSAVVWIERVNVTVSGDVLQKTSGCDGCFDAGATSEQQITPATDTSSSALLKRRRCSSPAIGSTRFL